VTEWFTTVVLALLAYSYVFYPLTLVLRKRLASEKAPLPSDHPLPPATLLILARNEQSAIEQKLSQVAALDYPELSVMVISDGSDDETATLARNHYSKPHVIEFDTPRGKTIATLEALERVETDLLFFTDAPGVLATNSLHILGTTLVSEGVGCAGGRVFYGDPRTELEAGFGLYQRIARAVRDAEGAGGTATVISGAIHGAWRSVIPTVPGSLSLELAIPLETTLQNKKSVYVAEAICVEESRKTWGSEWKARLRMGMRSWAFLLHLLAYTPGLLGTRYLFHFWSHKGLRWLGGPLCMILFISGELGGLQTLLLLIGGLSVGEKLFGKSRLVSLLIFFFLVNGAYALSLSLFILGKRQPSWKPERPVE